MPDSCLNPFDSSSVMNESKAYCPRCGKMVAFVKSGAAALCPECGFQYELSEPRFSSGVLSAPDDIGVLGVLFRVFLIMVVVAAVGVGVVFAGCALMFR